MGCQAHGIEEASFQACEQLSLGERGCWGSDFPRGSLTDSCSALRLPVWPIVEALEGEWGKPKDCRAEKGHTPWGGTGMWGMRDYKLWM
jgi:hypothetical protein